MIENSFNFTISSLTQIECPPSGKIGKSGRVWVYDTKLRGLAYCATEGGSRTFYLYRRVNGKPARIKIGNAQEISLEQARRRAAELNNEITAGKDPIAEKRARIEEAKRKGATLGDLWQSYLDGHLVHKKASTVASYTHAFARHLAPLKSRLIAEITPGELETLRVQIGQNNGKYMANRVLELITAMYRSRGHLFGLLKNYSPTADVEKFDEQARDRVLKPDELARLVDALNAETNDTIRDFFLMLLYTGARKNNVAGMRWQDISLQRKEWKIPGALMKNGSPLVVPLVPEAVAIIARRAEHMPTDSPFVFPAKRLTAEQVMAIRSMRAGGTTTRGIAAALNISQSAVMRSLSANFQTETPQHFNGARRAWLRLLERARISERATIHDLRRTFCTAMIEAGIGLSHVATAMGHRDIATTQKHYAIARQDAVRHGVEAGVAGMLAAVKQANVGTAAKKTAGVA